MIPGAENQPQRSVADSRVVPARDCFLGVLGPSARGRLGYPLAVLDTPVTRAEVGTVAFIEWTTKYRINVDVIDEQHRRLVQMVNDLYDAMVERRSAEGVRDVIVRMDEYAREHFSVEEAHMTELDYPDRREHVAQHARFTRKTRELQDRLASGKLILSLEVISYLRDWLTHHILHTDKQLGRFLNEHGIR